MSVSLSVRSPGNRHRSPIRGLSLIELLVAMAIAALLLLGLSQIFIGSRLAYSLQQGMSRSQENARFIFSDLESNVRMAGYFGCGNESSDSRKFYNHLVATAGNALFEQRFQRPLEGFQYTACTATSCDTDSTQPLAGTAKTQWTPSLPDTLFTSITGTTNRPVAGSDILVLRVLSAQSTPALGQFNPANGASFTVAPVSGDPDFVKEKGLYAIANCRPRVDIFKAATGSTGTTIVTNGVDNPFRCVTPDATQSTWGCTQAESDFRQPPIGQVAGTLNAEVHKAQYLAYYVGVRNDADKSPALFVQKIGGSVGEEIADGVESMQITYGIDRDGDGLADNGEFISADQVDSAAATAPACASDPVPADCKRDVNWRRVVSIHIALLMRGQDRATAPKNADGNAYQVGDARMTRPPDARFRDVYETTIALRNRLSNF